METFSGSLYAEEGQQSRVRMRSLVQARVSRFNPGTSMQIHGRRLGACPSSLMLSSVRQNLGYTLEGEKRETLLQSSPTPTPPPPRRCLCLQEPPYHLLVQRFLNSTRSPLNSSSQLDWTTSFQQTGTVSLPPRSFQPFSNAHSQVLLCLRLDGMKCWAGSDLRLELIYKISFP
ncbi:hypothetical protein BJX65DRAFT_43875 [Aspergillus insuetus]